MLEHTSPTDAVLLAPICLLHLSFESLRHPPPPSAFSLLMKHIRRRADKPHKEVALSYVSPGEFVIIEFVLMNAFPG